MLAAMPTNFEPSLTTGPELLPVLEELRAREPIFHRPEWGSTRADFEAMMAPDFWEVGASGRRYSREFALAELERRYAGAYQDDLEATDFHCRRLADDVYLLTYTLVQDKRRRTRRSTIWQRHPGGWQIVFHQGTLVQEP